MPPASSTRRDILSAYLASFTRIASWAVISALIYRRLGSTAFALLALVRSTLGVLNYTSLGLAPALIHYLAKLGAHAVPVAPLELPPDMPPVLSYAAPAPKPDVAPTTAAHQAYASAVVVSIFLPLIGFIFLLIFTGHTATWLHVPDPSVYLEPVKLLIYNMGIGILLRILSDPAGAVLQTFGRIALDNLLLAITDLLWVILCVVFLSFKASLDLAGTTFLGANLLLLLARYAFANHHLPNVARASINPALARSLFSFGLLLTFAQLADYLYAPTDFLLINHFLSTKDLAAYAPCVQIDAALLLLVTGLSTVLLPKAALAHARNDIPSLRRYYLTGTLLSTLLLLAAALTTWLAAPLLLRLWLHDIPPGTLAVLPLVLCHTVIGGSSAVGRSILLGSGRVKPFTSSVLLAGLANVLLSYLLVRHTSLGLTGIILGTLTAVTARCALWTPWYTLRTLRPTPPKTRSIPEFSP